MGAVFLVEDEALIRMMIADMVEELGHRVVAEAGSIQAAEPLARTTVFDLGILDINIGGPHRGDHRWARFAVRVCQRLRREGKASLVQQ